MDVVKQVRYDSAFTFIYSKRTGTRAATMENQVPDDVVKDRFDRLLKEVQTISSEKANAMRAKWCRYLQRKWMTRRTAM